MINTTRIISISRPRFWIYECGTFVIGALAAVRDPRDILTIPFFLFAFYFLFPANLFIYSVNDIFDYETDRLNPKKQSYEDTLTPADHTKMWRHIFLWNAPFIVALFFFDWRVVLWGLLFLFFAGFYSAPPIRAKARPIFDSIFSASHYIATGVFGFVLMNSSGDIAWPAVCGALMWAVAMHAYSAVPDIEPDANAGLATIATLFGARGTIALCALLYATAAYIGFTYLGSIMLVLGALYLTMMTLSFLRPQAIMTHYKMFPALNTCAGGILFVLVLLSRI